MRLVAVPQRETTFSLVRLCLALISLVALAGSLLVSAGGPVQAQGGEGAVNAQVWARKLASGNVEFGLKVVDPSTGSSSFRLPNGRYLLYNSGTLLVGQWYYSSPERVG